MTRSKSGKLVENFGRNDLTIDIWFFSDPQYPNIRPHLTPLQVERGIVQLYFGLFVCFLVPTFTPAGLPGGKGF